MKLLAYNVNTGKSVFECANCAFLEVYKRRIVRRCRLCGHTDPARQLIRYGWRSRPVGYSRLIPVEGMSSARASMDRARAAGVRFECVRSFAGLHVRVLSVPNAKQKQLDRILENA